MNATVQGVDARMYLSRWLTGLVGMTTADIVAMPDDKWQHTFGGCTRPASELMADTISLLQWTAEAITGNVINDPEHNLYNTLKDVCATKDGAVKALSEESEKLGRAIQAASDEELNKVIMAPFGMEMPVFMLAQVAVSHVWYHDGQLNYKQCLLGDEKVHWRD